MQGLKKGLSIQGLVAALEPTPKPSSAHPEVEEPAKVSSQRVQDLKAKVQKLKDRQVRKEERVGSETQKRLERIEATKIATKTLDQWLPVVKKNREKDNRDFRQDLGLNDFRIQAKAATQRKSAVTPLEQRLSTTL
jgi:U3 small nucleolar RNA-associated protein 14